MKFYKIEVRGDVSPICILRFAVRERTGRAVEEALRAVVSLVVDSHVVPAFITGARQPVVCGLVPRIGSCQGHVLLDMICSPVVLIDLDRWILPG